MQSVLVVEDDSATRHLIRGLLEAQGYRVEVARDGAEALGRIQSMSFDLFLVDVWMPGMNGLELIARLRAESQPARVVVMTADETPATVLSAVREHAYRYIRKPVEPGTLLEVVGRALNSPPPARPIQVLSAKPDWVELLVPCERESAERIQSFLAHLDADLPDEVRTTIGQAFRELLMNAIEWGGRLDPSRDVRISYVRAKRALMYRIGDPGTGFKIEELQHSAVNNPESRPYDHVRVREEKGLRAGGFGILMARALVDELIYNEAHNEVILVKYLDA
jgi:CheY-like chemotaxis protein/anti-sigma regulatory factor (Ser/Thr protein kinase)